MTNPIIDLSAETTLENALKDFVGFQPVDVQLVSRPSKSLLKVYDRYTVDELDWPNTQEAILAQRYLMPMIKMGTQHYIDNINAEMRLLHIGEHVIPLLIVTNNYDNAYVCSPYAHYISLALDSLHMIKSNWMRKSVQIALKGLGKLLKKGNINKIAYVNHWLLSTDLYPKNLRKEHIEAITEYLKTNFPEHAIAFRSLNAKNNSQLQSDLKSSDFNLIATRQIFLTNTSDKSLFETRIIKSDLRLLKENDYEVIDEKKLSPQDFDRILKLYQIVALEHHSTLNPQINAHFIKLMIDRGFLKLKALKKNGSIDGVVGYYVRNNIFMCPFFGYDKGHADKNRLYRLLSTLLLLEAAKDNCTFHQSSGASFYKKIRRAVGHQEYMGVYYSHLPFKQRLPWMSIKAVMNTIGTIFMRKY